MSPPNTEDDRAAAYGTERAGMPRWLKLSLIVATVLALLVVVVLLVGGGGGHAPRRHGAPVPVTGP